MGMTWLETAVAVVQRTMVETGSLPWRDVARVLSETPALIGRDEDQGRPLAAGSPGHVLVWDPRPLSVVDPTEHASRSVNSPVAGLELPGRNRLTVLGGRAPRRGCWRCGRPEQPTSGAPSPGTQARHRPRRPH